MVGRPVDLVVHRTRDLDLNTTGRVGRVAIVDGAEVVVCVR